MPSPTRTPANGITAEVIRDCMQPYGFSPDLLEDFVAALPPPPPEASAAWRHRHLTRLVREVAIFMPADDAQARLAAEVVGLRELAGVLRRRAADPGVPTGELCRLSRTAADMMRAAITGERQLDRRQHMPAPFFGTLLADPVDVGALDAVWRRGAGLAGDPRVDPGPKPAAMPASLVEAGAGHGDTNSMDREAEGAPGDLAAVEVPHGLGGDPRVDPGPKPAAMPASLVVGESGHGDAELHGP